MRCEMVSAVSRRAASRSVVLDQWTVWSASRVAMRRIIASSIVVSELVVRRS